MRAYLLYKDKSIIGFKRIMNSGGGVFDKYRAQATSFIRYASDDLDKNIALYSGNIAIEDVNLEQIFPIKYKWLVGDVSLKNAREYIIFLNQRISDFQGREDNLKLLCGVLFIKFVLLTKIVETYLASASSLKTNGVDVTNLKLGDIGIGNTTLMYFDDLQALNEKTIDEWIAYKADPVEAKYFYSAMKRILTILIGDEK